MNLITWEDSYSVKVREIDEQHKKIIEIINNLYMSMKESREQETILSILNQLIDYASFHFSTEEKYFQQFNYEDTDNHVNQHNQYKKKMEEFLSKYKSGNEILSFEVLDFLEDWWLGHIQGEDKKYTQCFNSHNLY